MTLAYSVPGMHHHPISELGQHTRIELLHRVAMNNQSSDSDVLQQSQLECGSDLMKQQFCFDPKYRNLNHGELYLFLYLRGEMERPDCWDCWCMNRMYHP